MLDRGYSDWELAAGMGLECHKIASSKLVIGGVHHHDAYSVIVESWYEVPHSQSPVVTVILWQSIKHISVKLGSPLGSETGIPTGIPNGIPHWDLQLGSATKIPHWDPHWDL